MTNRASAPRCARIFFAMAGGLRRRRCVREAIRNFEGQEFDLVVTDIRMPDGTGMEVMRAAREASPETAVILLTAYGSVPDAVSAMRDGALDYLTKPIPFDQLQATAAQVMHRAKQMPVA